MIESENAIVAGVPDVQPARCRSGQLIDQHTCRMKQPARHDLIVVGLTRIDLAEDADRVPGLSVSRAAGDGVGECNADERRTCFYRCRKHASVLCAQSMPSSFQFPADLILLCQMNCTPP